VHLPDGADLKLVDEALNSVRTALEPAGKPPPPPPPAAAAAAKSPTTPRATHPESGATHTIDEVASMSLSQLRAAITAAGLSHADCLEKSELQARAREARACGASAVDQITDAVKGAGAFSAGGSVSDLAPPAAELAVWRRQQSHGIKGFIFEGERAHALLELGTRVHDIGAVVDGNDSPVCGTVVGWTTAQGRFFDTSGGCANADGCVRVYYDKKPAAHESNPWNVMAANRLLFLDAAAPDPPYNTLTRSRPPGATGEYGGKLGVGSRVRVKQSVSVPAYGWGGVKHGMVGVVIKIDSDGDLKVDFPGTATGWNCKPSEMEAVGGDDGETGGSTGSKTGGGHSAPMRREYCVYVRTTVATPGSETERKVRARACPCSLRMLAPQGAHTLRNARLGRSSECLCHVFLDKCGGARATTSPGSPWISLDLPGSPWISLDLPGSPWI
jgi:hypothetical protein